MSYKLHILIDHSADSISKAISLTEEQEDLYLHKVVDLYTKVSNIKLGVSKETFKKTKLMETIQDTFSPAEMLLLACHSIEVSAREFCEIKANPMALFGEFLKSLKKE